MARGINSVGSSKEQKILKLTPTMDTSTYQDSATNYRLSTTLLTSGYSGYFMEMYMKFDLSSIPVGATIISAKAKLYKATINTNGHLHVFTARRITAAWSDATLVYANAPAVSSRYGPFYAFGPINEWSEIDLTQMVKDWLAGTYANYGWCAFHEADSSGNTYRRNSSWYSNEYATVALRPYLEVIYTV